MLDVVHEMMLSEDWPLRAVSVVFESHSDPAARFSFYGGRRPSRLSQPRRHRRRPVPAARVGAGLARRRDKHLGRCGPAGGRPQPRRHCGLGGTVSYDQPMPMRDRIGRLADGEKLFIATEGPR
ncbi:hypothetical protein HH310_12085 [Actinoplanes sp. TBRC 11911]|uniref:hypothetical protein n=1 Tax=Actinoplanes sp. TBRC 11911 TaxID=2729386 RepID=UPI00145E5619|nr:hypothetical protein [Actinoplanes sp. TBRC 11911]NMO51931.1 hypothetical protein [Actinoplanes sp. TBRC 11911]